MKTSIANDYQHSSKNLLESLLDWLIASQASTPVDFFNSVDNHNIVIRGGGMVTGTMQQCALCIHSKCYTVENDIKL